MSELRVPGIAKPCGVCGRFPDDPRECASVDLTPPATGAAPLQPCACFAYDAESDEPDAACECGHSVEEHTDGPCSGEVAEW